MPLMLAAAVVLILLGGLLFAASAVQTSRRRRLARRLAGQRGQAPAAAGQAWFEQMAKRGQRFDNLIEDPKETAVLLARAGWRGAGARNAFYAAQLLLPLFALVSALPLWFLFTGFFGTMGAVLVLVVWVLFFAVLPRMFLRSAAKGRHERLRAEVPLFINLIILLFEAGLSTRQALTSLVQDGGGTLPELTTELAPALRQIEAGAEMNTVLLELGKTLAVPELESVLGILRQVERYGGEVREPLTEALEVVEERRAMEIRERVNILSGKMTVVLVGCFFPALLIFIVGPAFVSIARALSSIGGNG